MKKLSQFLCIALILVMMLSMVTGISVKASETDSSVLVSETEPTTESITTAPEETEPFLEDATIETVPILADELPLKDSALLSTRATYDNGKYRQKAVIWTTNGESVEYTYNGKDNNYNQLLMHTLWYNDDWRAAYCIEPGKTVFVNSDYDEEENSGVDPWGQLPFAKQRGVSLTLLYGYPNGLDSDDLKTQIAYQLATYLIVHEIILGWRQDVHPFARTNDHYFDVFGGGTPDNPESLQITSEFYSEVHTKYLNREDIWYAYNHISDKLATHDLVPSFTSKLLAQAPTHTMTSNGDGTYSITLTDTNNILSSYSFTDTADLTFKKSADGKSLTITTSNKTLATTTVSPTRILPSVDNSAFLIWNAETGSQELCSLKAASDDPVPAYFKLKLPLGDLTITKTTDDDQNLGGWQFNIYSNAACTKKISGPHTTNSKGSVTITGLEAGSVWVKEIGHEDSNMLTEYELVSTAKGVTIDAGTTSTVTFHNKLIPPGRIEITKTTSDGKNLSGWQFGLYSDKACTNLLASGTSDSSGKVTFLDVEPGTVWVKELGHTTGSVTAIYNCESDNPQKVTVKADTTSKVSFENTLLPPGKIIITKNTSDGKNLSGWQFGLYSDKACETLIATATTDSSGKAVFPSVEAGNVWVKELGNNNSSITVLYECISENPQKVTVQRNTTKKLTFENELLPPGKVKIVKTTSDGNNLSGWQFNIYSDRTCTKLISGPHTSGTNGQIVVSDLSPGTIWVKEIGHQDQNTAAQYACSTANPVEVTIVSEQTSSAEFVNSLLPPGKIKIKKTTEDGENLSGWSFGIYSDEACTNLLFGPYSSNPGGYLTSEDIRPGTYWVKEIENSSLNLTLMYRCDSTNPQKVVIKAGTTTELEFHNSFSPPGEVIIKKTCDLGDDLGGWKFNFYSDPVCSQLVSGPHVTDSDGNVTISDIVPGVYWIKEVGNTNPTTEIRYRSGSANPLEVTVLPDETVEAAFHNLMLPPGRILISKTTEDTQNLAGWRFVLFADEQCKEVIGGPYVTDDTGSVVIPSILAGTYWLQEIGHQNPILSEVYQCEGDNPREIQVQSGQATSAHFVNSFAPPGTIELYKTTDTGGDLAGWIFGLYSDEECTQLLFNAGETDANGRLTVTGLHPGHYWIREEGNTDTSLTDLYQCGSTNPQYVRIYSGESTVINFANTTLPPGMLRIFKKTDDSANLGGWLFALYNDKECTQLAHGPFTTFSDGSFVTTRIWQGTYWIKELGNEDSSIDAQYRCSSENPQQITVTSGKMTEVTFENVTVPKGSIKIIKSTSDGLYLNNWRFVIYGDEACTNFIGGSYSTGADGTVTISGLTPGTVWIQEIGHANPTITSYYTCVSDNPAKVTILSGETVEVHFQNDTVPDGSVHLMKTTNSGTGLDGWQFALYNDYSCTELIAGPYATDDTGALNFPDLKPGMYWIKELGNEDPEREKLYTSDSDNPQKVNVISGQTVTVFFHNILSVGSITVNKTDPDGNALSGAQFLLEWSEDGITWKPVYYSEDIGMGTTSTPGVENGILITNEDGCISYAGLNSELQYRLSEVKAPNGYQLLPDYAFQGKLSSSDLSVSVTVVNTPTYTLPYTGSKAMISISFSIALCMLICIFSVNHLRRKEI